MISTLKLLNSYFFKTFYGPILAFIFPVILLLVLGNIFKIEYVYPGIIALSFLFIGLLSLPLSIMELKQSSLFKYIGSSPVNPIKFSLTIILFYVLVSLLTTILILVVTMIAFHRDVYPQGHWVLLNPASPSDTTKKIVDNGFKNGILGGVFWTWQGAASFLIALIMHLVFVISIGLFISTIAKTPQQSLTTGLIIIIPSMFLSGMIISVDIIAESKALNWVSRMIPFRYTTGNLVVSSTPKAQLGDMIEKLSYSQRTLIFGDAHVNGDGIIHLRFDSPIDEYKINNMLDLRHLINLKGAGNVQAAISTGDALTKTGGGDVQLFNLTLLKANNEHVEASDNNIFNWLHPWSVTRVPQVEPIKAFITDYFKGFESGGSLDTSKLVPFGNRIMAGDYSWLEIFMQATKVLYTKVDRILNIVIPISVSMLCLWYTVTHFSWSAR